MTERLRVREIDDDEGRRLVRIIRRGSGSAMAAFTAGSVETALGRYDDALHHLREVRELADRPGEDWLAGGSRVQLGMLAVLRGSLDEARALLDEALDRAALLEGAADRLRRRVSQPGVAASAAVGGRSGDPDAPQLGPGQFDQAFSAGSRLTQRQAVAIVQHQRGTGTPAP